MESVSYKLASKQATSYVNTKLAALMGFGHPGTVRDLPRFLAVITPAVAAALARFGSCLVLKEGECRFNVIRTT